jgi:hypothetical protein
LTFRSRKSVYGKSAAILHSRRARTGQTAGEKFLVKQFARIDIRKNSFAVRIADNWNQLPESVRAEKLPPCRRKLKRPGSMDMLQAE